MVAQQLQGVLEMVFYPKFREVGVLCDLRAGHALCETKGDADPMDGLEGSAAGEEEFEVELGLLPGGLFVIFSGPFVFHIVAAPVVGGPAFGDGKEPCRELVSIDLVPALMPYQEYLTG